MLTSFGVYTAKHQYGSIVTSLHTTFTIYGIFLILLFNAPHNFNVYSTPCIFIFYFITRNIGLLNEINIDDNDVVDWLVVVSVKK